MSKSRTYKIWDGIIQRCTNPNSGAYDRYGGRGITICDKWRSFNGFLDDMGEAPKNKSIERINNDSGYHRENCKWATAKEQNVNRSNTRWISAFGKTQHLSEWSRETGISRDTLAFRLRKGWPIEMALTHPVIRDMGKRASFHRPDSN